MQHPVVWFEVMGENGERLQSFYSKLFGWKIDASNPMKYGMVEAVNGQGIPGGVGQLGDQPGPKSPSTCRRSPWMRRSNKPKSSEARF